MKRFYNCLHEDDFFESLICLLASLSSFEGKTVSVGVINDTQCDKYCDAVLTHGQKVELFVGDEADTGKPTVSLYGHWLGRWWWGCSLREAAWWWFVPEYNSNAEVELVYGCTSLLLKCTVVLCGKVWVGSVCSCDSGNDSCGCDWCWDEGSCCAFSGLDERVEASRKAEWLAEEVLPEIHDFQAVPLCSLWSTWNRVCFRHFALLFWNQT